MQSHFRKVALALALSLAALKAHAIEANCAARLESGENRFHAKISKGALHKLSFGIDQLQGRLTQKRYVLLVDYSKNSTQKRAFVLDLKACDVVSQDYVIHGGTTYHPTEQNFGDIDGDGMLDRCEHANGSRRFMTRPGLYMTWGCHQTLQSGWTQINGSCQGVKLVGLQSTNRDALARGVVLHEHESIPDDSSVKPAGQGCPAFPPGRLRTMMKYGMFRGALVLVYAPQCDRQQPQQSYRRDQEQNQQAPMTPRRSWAPIQ